MVKSLPYIETYTNGSYLPDDIRGHVSYHEHHYSFNENTNDPYNCLKKALKISQDCSNNNIVYFTQHSTKVCCCGGFASELGYCFVEALLDAVLSNKRLVYVIDRGIDTAAPSWGWEYNCPLLLGYACYFVMPHCIDSVIVATKSNFQYISSNFMKYEYVDKAGLHDYKVSLHIDEARYLKKAKELLLEQPHLKNSSFCQDILSSNDIWTPTHVTSILLHYIYHLNSNTKRQVNEINSKYKLSPTSQYLAIHVRLGDKTFEYSSMNANKWAVVYNMTYVSDMIKDKLRSYNLNTVFMSSDNCSYVENMRTYFTNTNLSSHRVLESSVNVINFISPCFIFSNDVLHRANNTQSKEDVVTSTFHLFSELEVLSKAYVYLGMFESNFDRLVLRLRSEGQRNRTFGIDDWFDNDFRYFIS